jgi:4-hydroxy-3-methylbut-2-enyl diphosphate reductase
MRVIRADVLGFCMGVRRAVELAQAEAARGGKVCTLGPLIHNPRVLEDLQKRGVEILDEENIPASLQNTAVIIRAHGVSPAIEARLWERGGRVIDATCPRVKMSQLKAQSLAEAGYSLFLAGEERHAEIAGIRGYAAAAPFCAVVGNAAMAETAAASRFSALPDAETALIGQTTISAEEYRATGEAIKQFFPRLEIAQTICAATAERQNSLRRLLGQVDAVIIAGGKESANTRRLLAIAAESGKPCALAETAAGIPAEFAVWKTVGICAGASTPDAVIDEIEQALRGA